MRIRQIKPSFWTDPIQKQLDAALRLLYIGLWMLADDAGWLRYDVAEIAASILPYDDVVMREALVSQAVERLAELGRIDVRPCGHAVIPTLSRHQRISEAKRVFTVEREHLNGCRSAPAGFRGDDVIPAASLAGTGRDGTERNGSERDPSAEGGNINDDHPNELRPSLRRRKVTN